MGSALLNPAAALEFAEPVETGTPGKPPLAAEHAAPVPATVEDLRRQVAAQLAAHRSRRSSPGAQPEAARASKDATGRSARIAAAVAERYARTPSYRDVLAAEAERAIQQARAAAEVAAQNAQAIAAAQQRLLAAYDQHAARGSEEPPAQAVAMELWPTPEVARELAPDAKRSPKAQPRNSAADAEPAANAPATLTVRLYEDEGYSMRGADSFRLPHPSPRSGFADSSAAEALALDEEIAFRQAPVFEEPAGPPISLPANLIEFPRQLVAARKARPRYAEGPLRDELDAVAGDSQLRIFEVDPAFISTAPEETTSETAQWTSIWLDAPAAAGRANSMAAEEPLDHRAAISIEPATLARRAAAGAINLGLVATGTAAFAGMAALTLAHTSGMAWYGAVPLAAGLRLALPVQAGLQAKAAGIALTASAVFLLLLYYALFFACSTATPGMRAVRIAFCTFADENPTRREVRRRALASLLSALPLGMGFAWAALDEDRLTWHDRMSRMYLRRY